MKKSISVIIVTYNSESHIYDCLDSLFKYNDIGDALEVIVVDNDSKEVDILFQNIDKLYGNQVIKLKNSVNGGYGQGNNVGIRLSTASIFMIMNPDVRIIFPIFKKALNHLEKTQNVMLGMRQYVSEKKKGVSFACSKKQNILFRLFLTPFCNKFDIYFSKYMYLAGACFFMKKNVFVEIGMFDENIFMYGEENDIHYRLQLRKESNILFDKNMKYLHLIGDRPLNINTVKQMYKAELYFHEKNGFDQRECVKKAILSTQYFLFREKRRSSVQRVAVYKEWLSFLKS
jgi:GT2 family glycosyltransferase